jgi:hypothetical protein
MNKKTYFYLFLVFIRSDVGVLFRQTKKGNTMLPQELIDELRKKPYEDASFCDELEKDFTGELNTLKVTSQRLLRAL